MVDVIPERPKTQMEGGLLGQSKDGTKAAKYVQGFLVSKSAIYAIHQMKQRYRWIDSLKLVESTLILLRNKSGEVRYYNPSEIH